MKREGKRTGVFTRRALLVAGAQLSVLGTLGITSPQGFHGLLGGGGGGLARKSSSR